MKDQVSGQLKMLIVSYTAFNLNFVQYFWLTFFWLILKSLHRISQT